MTGMKISLAVLALAVVAWIVVIVSGPREPVAPGSLDTSGGPAFVVHVVKPVSARAFMGLLPDGAFGYVPTPALVAPIEFTLPLDVYAASGGHAEDLVGVNDVIDEYAGEARIESWRGDNPWPLRNKGQ